MLTLRARWDPVDKFVEQSEGVGLLLRIVAYSYEWNYSGR